VSESSEAKSEISVPQAGASLESILCTEELQLRPSRPPDYEKENRALVALIRALADSPGTIFQTLADTILDITQCDSAGLSLLTSDGKKPDVCGKRFYWPAISGVWNPHVGGGTPRNFGPCGDVLDQNRTLLFRHFERRYPYLVPVSPAAEECLLVPFYVAGEAVGTIWAITHSERRKFDAEDDRVMASLGKFASSAYQAVRDIENLKFQACQREKAEAELRELTSKQTEEERDSALSERTRNAAFREEIGNALALGDNLREILNNCAAALVRHLDAAFARIWTLGSEGRELELQASAGMYTHLDGAHSRIPMGELKIGRIAQERRPHLTNDVQNDPRVSDHEWARRESIVSFAGYPLVAEKRTVGVMGIFSRKPLTDLTLETLSVVADTIAQGILRRQAQEALRRSEAYLAEAQRLTHTGTWAWTPSREGKLQGWHYWSEEMFRVFEFDPRQGPPTSEMWWHRIHPEDRHQLDENIQRALEEKREYVSDYRVLLPNGRLKYIHTIGHPICNDAGEVIDFVGTSVDLSEQKREESARLYIEERYRVVVETASDSVVVIDEQGAIVFANPATTTIFGYDPIELTGKPLTLLMPEYMRELHQKGLKRYLATGQRHMNWQGTELTALRKNGEEFPIEVSFGEITRDGHRTFTGFIRDISRRKQAEHALRRSEALLTESQRVSSTGSFSWQVATNKITWSEQLYRIYELEIGVPVTLELIRTRVHPEDLTLYEKMVAQVRNGANDFEWQYRLMMPDHSIKYLHAVVHATRDKDSQLEYIAAIQDVTARRRWEEAFDKARSELARISRLTTMGELAASIAHEVNQPLTAVTNNANACLRLLANDNLDPEVLRRVLEEIVGDCTRASAIIARIRAFIKKEPAEKRELDINEIIHEVLALAGHELQKKEVVVECQLTKTRPLVRADRVQLQQVLLNLIMNGIEAMTAVTDRPRLLWMQSQVDKSGDVLVAVRDSGTGLGSEPDRLFTPFFTTKSNGMGMGLAISRSLVESHDGRLWATPNAPHGAVFSFTLPAAAESASRVVPR
jgi:PAS domain S-box-containing protein